MKLPGLRWWMAGLLFLAAVFNYVDKNTLALLAPTIQADLHLTDQDYANIQNAFQLAYTIALLGSGVVVDRLGTRLSLALFVGWWSVANMLTAFARSATAFGGFRFMLGLGEAGNWTASPKTVAEWFPPQERGLAIAIYTAGTTIGMTIAPGLVTAIQGRWGWQAAFVVTGIAGLVWLVPWLWLCRPVKTHPLLGDAERQWIAGAPAALSSAPAPAGWTWLQAFGKVEVWCLLFGRMLSDPVWFFYQNWYPKYLVSARGLTQAQIKITWVIFLAAGLGSLFGGWIAGLLVKRGGQPARVRLRVMLCCAIVMPLSPLVAYAPTTEWSLAFASIIIFAHLAWLINLSTLVMDVVPAASLGKVFGIVAAGSSAGAIIMNDLVAKMVKDYSYTNWFIIAAGLHLAVIPLVMWGVGRTLKRKN